MANAKQSTKKRLNMTERAQQQMELHFPKMPKALMWTRAQNDGFTTVPRPLPIVMQAIDSVSKGTPAGHTLFCLWARSPDHPFITIENPAIYAAEAGFSGQRAVDSWRKRMKVLREHGLINVKKGDYGDMQYVLLMNPNVALRKMRDAGKVQDGLWSRFLDRLSDVGARRDLDAYDDYVDDLEAKEKEENSKTKTKEPKAEKLGAETPAKTRVGKSPTRRRTLA